MLDACKSDVFFIAGVHEALALVVYEDIILHYYIDLSTAAFHNLWVYTKIVDWRGCRRHISATRSDQS